MVSAREMFLHSIEEFLIETGIAASRLGMEAVSDPRFVFDLREGRSVGLDLIDKINRKMAELRGSSEAAE